MDNNRPSRPSQSPQNSGQPNSVKPNLEMLLKAAIQYGASDLHLKADTSPYIRIDGRLRKLHVQPYNKDELAKMIKSVVTDEDWSTYQDNHELDCALTIEGSGRFRVNAYYERQSPAIAARVVSEIPLNAAKLGLPNIVDSLAKEENGIIIVAGATGSGKTTTLAALVDYINTNYSKNIITIEDPIEIIHRDKKSIVSQRQVGEDTDRFGVALRSALRQDPDVILLGEIRDHETARIALTAAETGHLVLTTLHTINVTDSITRLINFFPDGEHKYIRSSLANSLRAIICQRLVLADGLEETREINGRKTRRIPVVEILVNKGRVPEAIRDPERASESDLEEIVKHDMGTHGMQTFNQHLLELAQEGKITVELALATSDNRDDLSVELKNSGLVR